MMVLRPDRPPVAESRGRTTQKRVPWRRCGAASLGHLGGHDDVAQVLGQRQALDRAEHHLLVLDQGLAGRQPVGGLGR